MHRLTIPLLLLAGCTWIGQGEHDERTRDADQDGSLAFDDCDDDDPSAYPGADEVCDGVDNDCDGEVDEDDAVDAPSWYADGDQDGFGDPEASSRACAQPSGYIEDDSDCDDGDDEVYPQAPELCDEQDNDCDGETDEEPPTWYADSDGDGYGDPDAATTQCEQPSGAVAADGDCDDGDAAVNPAATELCNGVDDDCDDVVDEEDAEDASTWYADSDGDDYGASASTVQACEQPSGYAAEGGDCDEGDAAIHPAATELCDGADNDCDGLTDEDDAADASTWYADSDGDGYGDSATSSVACEQPSGFVADSGDCDDGEASTHPGATEYCDGHDDDCDGHTDEADAADASTWYADTDGDGYGDGASPAVACAAPSGTVADSSDCDDGDGAIHPAATELCDGADNDCDGGTDEDDAADASTWYADSDGDGWGDSASTVISCSQPSGYAAEGGDCDEGEAAVHPGADELCNSIDDDCDGGTDEEPIDAQRWYTDGDGDGYGDPATGATACTQPSGTVADGDDCDDGDASVHPGAFETWYDGVDQDCSGGSDYDLDGDGYDSDDYGGTDFDDMRASCHPGAFEWNDGQDNDGDGDTDFITLDHADAVVYGDDNWDQFVGAMTTCDLDADGTPELVVGHSGDNTWGNNAGAVWVFSGPLTGSADSGAAAATLWGTGDFDTAGWALTCADFDGNGADDVAFSAGMGTADPNRVILFHSPVSDAFIDSATSYIEEDGSHPMLGESLASIEDVTGDGRPDLLVGNPWTDSQRGEIYLFSGGFSGLAGMGDVVATFDGAAGGDEAGKALLGEDLDGDGIEDLLIGAPYVDIGSGSEGSVYVLFGPVSTDKDLAADADSIWSGASSLDHTGAFLSTAGDVDADGYRDILIGSRHPTGGTNDDSAWLVCGRSLFPGATTVGSADVSFIREVGNDCTGHGLGGGGDFDGDGYDDVAIGAPYDDSQFDDAGRAFLMLGAPTGSLPASLDYEDYDVEWRGTNEDAKAGALLLMDADMDGDGLFDLLIGAEGADEVGDLRGAVYLVHGVER
jgi:hypothetical protein